MWKAHYKEKAKKTRSKIQRQSSRIPFDKLDGSFSDVVPAGIDALGPPVTELMAST